MDAIKVGLGEGCHMSHGCVVLLDAVKSCAGDEGSAPSKFVYATEYGHVTLVQISLGFGTRSHTRARKLPMAFGKLIIRL